MALSKPWWAWVGLLMVANMVMPFFFLGSPEALAVLVAFLVAGGIQMAIFHTKGFVRLLGIGHIIPWVPLLLWLWARLEAIDMGTALGRWIVVVIVLDGVSLLIDLVDVFRYLAGDRASALRL
jgi:hypothetical protein